VHFRRIAGGSKCAPDQWGTECLCYEDNTAYYGNNHRFGDENPQKTRLDCQQSCQFHPSCHYWTFRKPIKKASAGIVEAEAGGGLCYLKLKRDNVNPNVTDYVSGSKFCQLPEWTGIFRAQPG
jgi:type VI protein secretion system component Hcp